MKRILNCVLVFLVLQTLLFYSTACAQGPVNKAASPGWVNGKADPVSPEAAGAYYAQREAEQVPSTSPGAKSSTQVLQSASTQSIPQGAATEQTDEITELARGLLHDPKLIFDHVHNYIDYVPYFGSKKGATLTMLDGSGNDFDQASLMIALLRASGYTAQYQYGTMDFAGNVTSPLANWVGSSNNYPTILSSGGIPFSWAGTHYDVTRVWVKATINGTDYQFDPAFKTYKRGEKIDIGAALGYNRDELLAAAGGTVTSDYVQNLNESALNAKLTQYAMNYVNFIRTNHPNDGIEDVLGRRSILEAESTALPTSLQFPAMASATWDEVPTAYTTTLRVQHAGVDHTFLTPEVGGKRLTITYAGGDNHPELRLDGNLVVSGSPTSAGAQYPMVLMVNEPYAALGGEYGDQTETYNNKSGATYAIISGFGDTTDDLLSKRQRALDEAKDAGAADTSEQVLGENLNMVGLTWLKEVGMADKLISDVADGVSITHHRIGRMAQESNYFIDVAQCFLTKQPRVDGDPKGEWPAFRASMLFSSALEYGVLEQLMGADKPAVSTVKVLQMANTVGDKVFYATNSNFDGIRPQLVNYPAGVLNRFASQLSSGDATFLVLPQNGNYVLNSWQGKGYIRGTDTGLDMMVDLELHGGGGTMGVALTVAFYSMTQITNGWVYEIMSCDPIDMFSGSSTLELTDLSLGGAAPKGLAFSRYYSSRAGQVAGALGHGWSHSYESYVRRVSQPSPGLAGRLPTDAASAIAALCSSVDILSAPVAAKDWVTVALVDKWAADQLVQGVAVVSTGGKTAEYARLPDGTYAPPPGITSSLIGNVNESYVLQERFGLRMDFRTDGKAAAITDIDGNCLTFTYTSGQLSQVRDCYGRTLSFVYQDGYLRTVTDSTVRSVSYTLNAVGDLTSFTDPENNLWSYAYDSSHCLTSLSNPLGITTATNAYDSLGRVREQSVPRQGGTTETYRFYFSGYRNAEENPFGHKIVYFYDRRGWSMGQMNALGHRSKVKYDGQYHAVEVEDPRGHKTTTHYGSNNNANSVTNSRGETTSFSHDSLLRLTQITDPLLHKCQFAYDAEHHLTSSSNDEAVQVSGTYYADGLPQTATDGRGTISTITYDSYGLSATSQTTGHPAVVYQHNPVGKLTSLTDQAGAITSFTYDRRGLNTGKTDPLGRSTPAVYNSAGQLMSMTDRNGQVTSYAYTLSGKTDHIYLPGGSQIGYTYDAHDRLISMHDPAGTTSYLYDAADRVTSLTDPHGFTVGYTYDQAGNIASITCPGDKTIQYGRDELNRIATVTNWLGQTATYTYDTAGHLVSMINFNGTLTTYAYDAADRLVELQIRTSGGLLISTYRYALDGNGNRVQIEQQEPTIPQADALSVSYTYNSERNRLLSAGGTSYAWDLEGQIASAGTTAYSFDAMHRLVSVGGAYPSQFTYDGVGHRLQAVRSGVVTRYVYDAQGNLIAEADAANNITAYYIYGSELIARVTPNGQTHCYHFNGIGSTIALTDMNQNVVNQYAYGPFGEIIEETEKVLQPFKFVGQLGVVSESGGLLYMRARYYEVSTGRFISEDPLGYNGGDLNLYAYVGNNPSNWVDPNGTYTMLFYRLWTVSFIILMRNQAIKAALSNNTVFNQIAGILEQIPNTQPTLPSTASGLITWAASEGLWMTQLALDPFYWYDMAVLSLKGWGMIGNLVLKGVGSLADTVWNKLY